MNFDALQAEAKMMTSIKPLWITARMAILTLAFAKYQGETLRPDQELLYLPRYGVVNEEKKLNGEPVSLYIFHRP